MSQHQVFKTRTFRRWAKKVGVDDRQLLHAIEEMRAGLIDAELGSGVVKKRLAASGKGKRGGVRTIVVTNKGTRWIFVYGFEKNERDNIDRDELDAFRLYAKIILQASPTEIERLVTAGELTKVLSWHKK